MPKALIWLGSIILALIISFTIYITAIPSGVAWWTDYRARISESREEDYEARVAVENEARLRIVAYEATKLEVKDLYNQYLGSQDDALLEQRVRAKLTTLNNLAVQYNYYILENSHYWEDNIPSDIDQVLPTYSFDDLSRWA